MSRIRYPELRHEVIRSVEALADREYQERVWIRGEFPREPFFDDLTLNVHILFDDVQVLPDPADAVGDVLRPNEVASLAALGAALAPLLDELGDVGDAAYLAHPAWDRVISAAQGALLELHKP